MHGCALTFFQHGCGAGAGARKLQLQAVMKHHFNNAELPSSTAPHAERVQREEWRIRRVRLQDGSVHEHPGTHRERRRIPERWCWEPKDMHEDVLRSLESIHWDVPTLDAALASDHHRGTARPGRNQLQNSDAPPRSQSCVWERTTRGTTKLSKTRSK